MTTTELIAKLKRFPETAEVFFDDARGGLVDIEQVQISSPAKAASLGRPVERPVVILSDKPDFS